jgi:hypothetical protein
MDHATQQMPKSRNILESQFKQAHRFQTNAIGCNLHIRCRPRRQVLTFSGEQRMGYNM